MPSESRTDAAAGGNPHQAAPRHRIFGQRHVTASAKNIRIRQGLCAGNRGAWLRARGGGHRFIERIARHLEIAAYHGCPETVAGLQGLVDFRIEAMAQRSDIGGRHGHANTMSPATSARSRVLSRPGEVRMWRSLPAAGPCARHPPICRRGLSWSIWYHTICPALIPFAALNRSPYRYQPGGRRERPGTGSLPVNAMFPATD